MGRKRKRKPDRLSRLAAAAAAAGMSYGQYIAKYYPPGAPWEPKHYDGKKPMHKRTCPCCGTVFFTTYGSKIYCAEECRLKSREKRRQEIKKESSGKPNHDFKE